MAARRGQRAHESHDTRALLLRRVDYGDSDLVLTLFTEGLGRVSALARGARKSRRRFGGVLEPIHTLVIRIHETSGANLLTLQEARLDVTRMQLVGELARMEAAARALLWVRKTAPVRTPEPNAWRVLESLLDELDQPDREPRHALATAGLGLLGAFGWGLDLERCVSCGKPCPDGRSALLDVARGGVICRACGGGSRRLDARSRKLFLAASAGEPVDLTPSDVEAALEIVEAAFRVHAGIE